MPDDRHERLNTFADRLGYLLRAHRLPQVRLAEDLRTSQTNVSRWLVGTIPEMKAALALARRFDVSIEWLLEGIGEAPTRLEAFVTELRSHQLPAIERRINEALAKKSVNKELTQTIVSSLREVKSRYERMIEFAEKHGEAGLGLEYLESEKLIEDARRTRKKKGIDYRTMLCESMGVAADLSDDELEEAYETFRKRANQVGPVRAAAEGLKKKNSK
jgi:transcriptional regulator with XRE-family HTH domain